MSRALLFVVAALFLLAAAWPALAVERPSYRTIAEHEGWEVREYEPRLEAHVTVAAPDFDEAMSRGFRLLAGFIFGDNEVPERLRDTGRASAKIAMTAPVGGEPTGDGSWVVSFTMPSEYSADTLPRPLDDRVRIVTVDGGTWAALRFNGRAGGRHEALTRRLSADVDAAGLIAAGPAVVAQYNPPSIPPALRRNEILLPIRR